MNLRDRLEGALGFGVVVAVIASTVYQLCGTEVQPAVMAGFFLCAAVPTFIFTGE